ncbi:hypothetical protein IPC20_01295 [Pseudomonas aeruginosa]|nr:hypothetical protein IPC20_01295 [Pseudomonas aeruginosa]
MRSPPATGVRVCEKHQDFSDALRKRGIEEVNTPWRAGYESLSYLERRRKRRRGVHRSTRCRRRSRN